MRSQITGNEKIFMLPLLDGKIWGFSATKVLEPWMSEFISIMQLKEATKETNFFHRFNFVVMDDFNKHYGDCLNESEWTVYEQGSAYRIWLHKSNPETFIELKNDYINHPEIRYIYMLAVLKRIFHHYLTSHAGLSVHSVSAVFDGKGILIAAPGGVGKSTCYNRLPKYWQPLSDDMSLIVLNASKQFGIHPMPTWSDYISKRKSSTFNTTQNVPLKAIFFLEQSDKDEVATLNRDAAVHRLVKRSKETYLSTLDKLNKEEKHIFLHTMFEVSLNISRSVPCYILNATLDGKFWEHIENVLKTEN